MIPPKKTTTEGTTRMSMSATTVPAAPRQRRPWVKRTPIEVIIDQIKKVRDDVTAKEEELKQSKKQLQKLEEVQKALEST